MIQKQKKKQNFLHSEIDCLDELEKKKCLQKFASYKPLGSPMLSKHELKRVLLELGKQVSEEDLLEMVYEADPNGHGYISYEAFEGILQNYKSYKEETVSFNIGLTFQEILKSYNKAYPHFPSTTITWDYIQEYLEDVFQLKINIKSFKPTNAKPEVTKEEFKYIFS